MNKIDLDSTETTNCIIPNMKPMYSTNEELFCGEIYYNGRTYLVDLKDKDKIINFNKNFVFTNKDDIYPSYSCNYKKFSYIEFIFSYSPELVCYIFLNNNQYDLRKRNVQIYHLYHKNIIQKYNIIQYVNGHYLSIGQDANIMKNPMWKIQENGKEYWLMYCEKETICRLCVESYNKILDYENNFNNNKKITWYKHQNGYILCSNNLYIHQIITGCYGNGKGTTNVSVDHIDQDPLNNTWENLRIATRKEQEQNSKGIKPGTKRERKYNAQDLPDGITQEIMKKYVVYYKDYADKEKKRLREYFRIESHPKLDKIWSTTKSNKITIQEKLSQANKVVDDLENDIYPEKNELALPKYVSLIITREKPHLVFERKMDSKRLNIKMVLPEDYDLQEQLEKLNEKVKEKYEGIQLF
jgi:hypothetical protein